MKKVKNIVMRSLCCCFLLHMVFLLTGQQLYPVIQSPDTIHFHYGIENNKPALSNISLPPKGKFPDVKSIELTGGDLLIHFSFERKVIKYSPEVLTIQGLRDENGNLVLPGIAKLSHDDEKLTEKTGRRIWLDATEDVLDFHHDYDLIIVRSVMENVDCSGDKPAFSVREQWPHFAVGGVGLAAFGIGQSYKNKRDYIYAQYQAAWKDGLPEAKANQNFRDAEDFNKKSNSWTNVGIIIMSADLLVYSYRWLTIRHKKTLYNEFCSPLKDVGFSVSPLQDGSIASTLDLKFQF